MRPRTAAAPRILRFESSSPARFRATCSRIKSLERPAFQPSRVGCRSTACALPGPPSTFYARTKRGTLA